MAKQRPCAPEMIAVLTPITSPRELTSGPPELPGFSAASVWMMSSISRPDRERSDRPSALTTPAVTVAGKPNGLPIAIDELADADRLRIAERQRRQVRTRRADDGQVGVRIVADERGRQPAAVGERHVNRRAPWTTWLLVRMRPSGVKTNPEPCPPRAGRPVSCPTSMVTTDGPTASTARTTACEYASRILRAVSMVPSSYLDAQLALEDLSRRAGGQLGSELDVARILVGGELLLAPGLQLVFGELGARLLHHERLHFFAEPLVGDRR